MDLFDKYEQTSTPTERCRIVSFKVKRNFSGSGRFALLSITNPSGGIDEAMVDERFFPQLEPYIKEWEVNPEATVPCYLDTATGKWRFSYKAAADDEIDRIFYPLASYQPSEPEQSKFVRVQAYVTPTTREKIEAIVGKHGVGHFIREAINHKLYVYEGIRN